MRNLNQIPSFHKVVSLTHQLSLGKYRILSFEYTNAVWLAKTRSVCKEVTTLITQMRGREQSCSGNDLIMQPILISELIHWSLNMVGLLDFLPPPHTVTLLKITVCKDLCCLKVKDGRSLGLEADHRVGWASRNHLLAFVTGSVFRLLSSWGWWGWGESNEHSQWTFIIWLFLSNFFSDEKSTVASL